MILTEQGTQIAPQLERYFMSQYKYKIGSLDINRINLSQKYERQSWAKHFNITESDLKDAVKKAGVSVKAVEVFLFNLPIYIPRTRRVIE